MAENKKVALEKKDRISVCWRSTFLQGSWNYERMQNGGYCYAMIPAIKRLYTTKEEQAAALKRHLEFFNTQPYVAAPLEISTGKMTCANAGHEYPALYSADEGTFTLFKDRHGLVIGGLPDIHYQQYEIQLKKNDMLFVYTDGVPEATNEELNMYGTDRMLDVLNASFRQSPTEILEAVDLSVKQFVGPAEQFDDLTMLCLRYNGT